MTFTADHLHAWDGALAPLFAECRALPGVPPEEAAAYQAWVDDIARKIAGGEMPALVAREDGRPVGLAGYTRRGRVVRVHFLYMLSRKHEPVSDFLALAEGLLQPVRRIVVEGGPQTMLDEAVGPEGFLAAGYRRFDRVRMERPLDAPEPEPAPEGIVPIPVHDEAALVELQRAGYTGSPDWLLIDDFEDMVDELIHDPAFAPEASFAAVDAGRLLGAVYTFRRGHLAWIASLCVRPSARGRRLAGRLLARALNAGRDLGLTGAGLHVTLDNRPAMTLYRKMGFRLVDRLSLLYAKDLPAAPAADHPARETSVLPRS